MALPIVAIVGRPNVGKSTLFNRLLRQRKAIVQSEPGVTRDRLYATADWAGRSFALVDTGGLDWDEGSAIQVETTRQAQTAITEADVIIFVVDASVGVTPADEAVADVLRRSRKPVILAANKVDDPAREDMVAEFYRLGVGSPQPVSAYHGTGTGDLLDVVIEGLPEAETVAEEVGDVTGEPGDEAAPVPPIRVAIVGRPNVGKSSLVNSLLGEARVIVADEPGTTRDAIDVPLERDGVRYVLVDTAGLRKRAKVKESVEKYSILRTLRAVARADVVVLLLDATRPLAEPDKRVAGYVVEAGRALVLAVNKWDLVEKDDRTYLAYESILRTTLHYANWAPVVFVSALTGRNMGRLMTSVQAAAAGHRRRIPTPEVTQVFRDAVTVTPPPSDGRRRLKVGYVTQAETGPPTFVFFVNSPDLVTESYKRYLEGRAREAWDFAGTPIRLRFRAKGG
jgi:GTP-binding protein